LGGRERERDEVNGLQVEMGRETKGREGNLMNRRCSLEDFIFLRLCPGCGAALSAGCLE
jgi:hypothetical protein